MYTFLRICLSESERIKHYEKERNKQEIPNEGINLVLFLKTGCQTSLNSDKERDWIRWMHFLFPRSVFLLE